MQDDDQSNQTTNTRMARHTASQSRSIEQETFMDPRGVRQDLLSISDGIFSHFRERGKKLQRVVITFPLQKKIIRFLPFHLNKFSFCRLFR